MELTSVQHEVRGCYARLCAIRERPLMFHARMGAAHA
jgi:hypothetical protein